MHCIIRCTLLCTVTYTLLVHLGAVSHRKEHLIMWIKTESQLAKFSFCSNFLNVPNDEIQERIIFKLVAGQNLNLIQVQKMHYKSCLSLTAIFLTGTIRLGCPGAQGTSHVGSVSSSIHWKSVVPLLVWSPIHTSTGTILRKAVIRAEIVNSWHEMCEWT